MNHDDNDELWELLGKARKPKVQPFFTSKVMRAVRECREERGRFAAVFVWLRENWVLPAAAAACAALLAFINFHEDGSKSGATPASETAKTADPIAEIAKIAAQDDDIEASIDSLFAAEDNSVWLSADPSAFLP